MRNKSYHKSREWNSISKIVNNLEIGIDGFKNWIIAYRSGGPNLIHPNGHKCWTPKSIEVNNLWKETRSL